MVLMTWISLDSWCKHNQLKSLNLGRLDKRERRLGLMNLVNQNLSGGSITKSLPWGTIMDFPTKIPKWGGHTF